MDTLTSPEAMALGDRVRFERDRRWWDVRARDARFVILTRQAEFKPKGSLVYTIIDRERGVRGPCDRIGQGWDVQAPDGPQALLRALQRHDEIAEIVRREGSYVLDGEGDIAVEVSYRNNVPIHVTEVHRRSL